MCVCGWACAVQNRGGNPTAADLGHLVAAATVNGDGPGGARPSGLASSAPASVRERELAEENKALRQEVVDLRVENEDLGLLAQDYDTVLEKVLEGLRVYAVSYACCGFGQQQQPSGSNP